MLFLDMLKAEFLEIFDTLLLTCFILPNLQLNLTQTF